MTDTAVDSFEPFIARARALYTLPAVAVEVLELTNQPQVDTRALRNCIEKDPALTIKVLRVVNSSLFGLSRQVTDLSQALGLLGTKPLKMLVLGFSLPAPLFEGADSQWLSRYWRHTAVKAVAARELCDQLQLPLVDEAFIAGLLQDIGQLVLLQELGESYTQFLLHVDQQGGDLRELEVQALGFDHAMLSRYLLDHWRLPETVVAAVAVPFQTEKVLAVPVENRPLVKVLHLAELVSSLLDGPTSAKLKQLLLVGREYFGLSYQQVQVLVATMQPRVAELAEVLSLDMEKSATFSEILAKAHGMLSDVATVASVELLSLTIEEQILEQAEGLRGQLQTALARTDKSSDKTGAAERSQTKHGSHPKKPPTSMGMAASSPVPATQSTGGSALAAAAKQPAALARIDRVIGVCRQKRVPVSLVLFGLDQWETLANGDAILSASLLQELAASLGSTEINGGELLPLYPWGFGIVWEDCDRPEGLATCRNLQRSLREACLHSPEFQLQGRTASFGLATLVLPPKNFPPQDLVAAAARCFSGALLSGGDTVKSFEI